MTTYFIKYKLTGPPVTREALCDSCVDQSCSQYPQATE